jgi:hypothetical protein
MLTMTVEIRTVDVMLCWRSTMTASAYDVSITRVIDRHGQPLVKDVAQSVPHCPFRRLILAVGNDAAIKLVDIGKSFCQHEGCEFFTTDTTGAIGEDGALLIVTKRRSDPFWKLPE